FDWTVISESAGEEAREICHRLAAFGAPGRRTEAALRCAVGVACGELLRIHTVDVGRLQPRAKPPVRAIESEYVDGQLTAFVMDSQLESIREQRSHRDRQLILRHVSVSFGDDVET